MKDCRTVALKASVIIMTSSVAVRNPSGNVPMVIASRNLATATVLHNVATSLMKAINNVASIIMAFIT
jgi:hypothetical protein